MEVSGQGGQCYCGQRTRSVSPPQDAETEEPETEADVHGSDMFASAESEVVSTPTRELPRQVIEAANLRRYHYHRRDGKIRRLRPEQFGHLDRGMTSYQFMMRLDRGVITDSDDEGEF
eukprot:676280-Amphidinium_carterae.1